MSKKKEITEGLGQSIGVGAAQPEKDYETEGHLKTLMDAHGIMGDEEKMTKVRALAGRQHKALAGIKKVKVKSTNDLRDLHNKKFGPNHGEEDGDME